MEEVKVPQLLVIGGTGFIGHHLLKATKKECWNVTSVSLNPPEENEYIKNVRYLHFDLTDLNLTNYFLNEDFDYVVNLGGYIDHQLFKDGGSVFIDSHFTALKNLLEVLPRKNLKKFIQIGSSDEYGNAVAPQKEEFRESPISPYSLAKVASTHLLEMLYRTENFPAVILRLFLTYGPGQDSKRFIPQIIRGCLLKNPFPTSDGKQIRDFCYVEDTITAIIKALKVSNINGEIFNIGSGKPITIRKIIEKVCSITKNGEPLYGEIKSRPGENKALYADISKAKNNLHWEPKINIDTGLKKTIDWFVNGSSRK